MPLKPRHLLGCMACLCIIYVAKAESPAEISIAGFSNMSVTALTPPGWRALTFESIASRTAYFLTRQDDRTVVQAVSHAGASALFKELSLSAREYPILKWQWKIDHVLEKADPRRRSGDDYPARIYISFEYDPNRLDTRERIKYKLYSLVHDKPPPLAVLNYIWDTHTPAGTIITNAYSDRVKMIVVRSGPGQSGKWLQEQRNVFADYRQAFGEDPGKITGIAIMTDTDNTGESATAWYGDISIQR